MAHNDSLLGFDCKHIDWYNRNIIRNISYKRQDKTKNMFDN